MIEKLKKFLPYLLAFVFLVALSYAYFSPVLQGKAISQMDLNHSKGMAQELVDFKAKTGENSQWTNSMFGGMPAYNIYGGTSHSVYTYIHRYIRFGMPYTTVGILFLYMFGFYLLLLSLKFTNLQSVMGGMSFGLASYKIIIIAVGHITKTYAIAFMAPVIAGILMTYRGKYLWGAILTAFALGVEIAASHIQIVYYLALMVFLLIAVKFVYAVKEKQIKHFIKASSILLVAAVFAVLPNITGLSTTYEYGQQSNRGASELSEKKKNDTKGTDRDYAYSWSYGIGETLTLMIPNVKGGASRPIGFDNMDIFDKVDKRYIEYIGKQSAYHGNQSFTAGPVYMGAIIIFLFILGLFIVKGDIKWWIFASAILGILLSWGGNFKIFTDFFIDYVPLYNKFRTLSMSLVITGFAVVLMAMFTIKQIIENRNIIKEKAIYFYLALALTAGVSLLIYIMPATFLDFLSNREAAAFAQQKAEQANMVSQINLFVAGLESARKEIVRADALRSFVYIMLSALVLYIYSYTNIIKKKEYLVIALISLIVFDMWTIDKRYLNNGMFVSKRVVKNEFHKTNADKMILKDKDPDYRVLSYLHSPFNDGFTPYFHKSIGGYHGAKMRRYQELIEKHLGREVQIVANAYQRDKSNSIATILSQMNIINMLNTKYIIYTPNEYEVNWSALGHGWYVNDYTIVENADEEIRELATFEPQKTAVIDKRFKEIIDKLPEPEITPNDSTALIFLESYKPNHLVYKTITERDRFAVFSEIYYDKGWNAYVDGKKTDHVRANYVLRAMIVPKGKHTIEFKFEPQTYIVSQKIALGSSIFMVLVLIAMIAYSFKGLKARND